MRKAKKPSSVTPVSNVVLVDNPTKLVTVRIPGPTPPKDQLLGAIVRIIAAPGQSTDECEAVAKEIATDVKRTIVIPSANSQIVPNDAHTSDCASKSMREVLTELVEASGYPDKAELANAVELIASEVGL